MDYPHGIRTHARAACASAALLLVAAAPLFAIPSYARQTKLPCSACHTQFLELNDFGRTFKLNGYVLRVIEEITVQDSSGHVELSLNALPIVSIMALSSVTRTGKAQPGTLNSNVLLPDQLSVFLAGAISPRIGAFVQVTLDPQSGTIGLDNTEFRYASVTSLAAKPLAFGFSLNNNPTMSDLWNSTPVWGFPFVSAAVAPAPAAAALIDGTLGQQVAGLTAFGYWNNTLYGEFGAYRSAPIGHAQPLDSTAEMVTNGVAPYWRAAYTRQWGANSLMLGTYGMVAHIFPGAGSPLSGVTDHYTDIAADFQYGRAMGENSVTLGGTWIHERRDLKASEPGVAAQTLDTYRARATYRVGQRLGFSAGAFAISGDADQALYAPGPVTGSRTGGPNSSGAIGEIDFNPWQNVRLGLQYTAFSKFNGSGSDYDGSGRSASANNTLYLFAWLLY